ncbi:uncharacterized protein LOC129918338 [Episyrphus balteatus]|uniref:uncharacterized protein LOC129918338 n=1 Tax=Episyrphus balteatus TaxID=286459 RepID=UPI00248657AC|nr:uncharacterized protein LOC129918338 [Episyrphus balteatus]
MIKKNSKQSTALKIKFVREVKKHPIIWFPTIKNGNYVQNKEAEDVWKKVQKTLEENFNFPKDYKYRKIWQRIRKYYLEVLEERAIKNITSFPTWELFHELTYLYETTLRNIVWRTNKTVPKLVPNPKDANRLLQQPCPCCLPLYSEENENESKKRKMDDNENKKINDEVIEIEENDVSASTSNVPIPIIPVPVVGVGCVSMRAVGVDVKDDLKVEDLDKLQDYDREVLFFSDSEVVCIEDDVDD